MKIQDLKGNVKVVHSTQPQKSSGGAIGAITDFGIGAIKGLGRSALNFAKSAVGGPINQSILQPGIGIGPFSLSLPRPEIPDTLESLQPTNRAQKIGGYAETAAEILLPLPGEKARVGASLIGGARKLYESVLKLPTTLTQKQRSKIIDTAFSEGINATTKGLSKVSALIDDLEGALGAAIRAGAGAGKRVTTASLKPFVDEAKQLLGNTGDVVFSENATRNIDKRFQALIQKFGDDIPVGEAQSLKTNTYKLIKNSWGKLSTSTVEYQKQIARGLREGILEVVPSVGGINQRLGALYEFSTQLERALSRTRNTNVVSLGGKVLASGGNSVATAVALVHEIFGTAGAKTFGARQLERVGRFLSSKSDKDVAIATGILSSLAKLPDGVLTGLTVTNVSNIFQGISKALSRD